MDLKIYVASSITGMSYEETERFFKETKDELQSLGFMVFNPMTAKTELRTEKELKADGYHHPTITDNAILYRDHWMVLQADIVYVDLSRAEKISIGCCFEIAWAWENNKHLVVVLPKNNPHRHAFVKSAAHIVFETTKEAFEYFDKLSDSVYGYDYLED